MLARPARILVTLGTAGVAAALACAAPAAADQESFIRPLATRYVFLSDQQLAAEGAKICSAIGGGMTGSGATIMVRNDLGVSVSAAGEIVSAAVVHLDC